MKNFFAIFLLACLPTAFISAATFYVDDDNGAAKPNGTADNPFKDIQAAIVKAKAGDTIKVALGTYSSITTLNKPLTLLGGYPGATAASYTAGEPGDFARQGAPLSATIIKGTKNGNAVTITRNTMDSYRFKFDNFTVKGGLKGIVCDTEFSFPHATNVVISRCRVELNGSAGIDTQGGGILITGNNGVISDNLIRANKGGRGPAIIRVAETGKLTIRNNRIYDNICYSDHGGGVSVYGNVFLENNDFLRNRVSLSYGWGGAILILPPGKTQSVGNVYRQNHAPSYGGGVFVDEGATAVFRNDLVYGNTTETGYGGGVAVDDGEPGGSSAEFSNCTIVNNNVGVEDTSGFGGNGLFVDGTLEGSSTGVTNCIFWGNGDDFARRSSITTIEMTYSNSQEKFTGKGNLTSDPKFLDAAGNDFRLKSTSPCVNSGLLQSWMTGAKDLAGNPRVVGSKPDRGAYELQ